MNGIRRRRIFASAVRSMEPFASGARPAGRNADIGEVYRGANADSTGRVISKSSRLSARPTSFT